MCPLTGSASWKQAQYQLQIKARGDTKLFIPGEAFLKRPPYSWLGPASQRGGMDLRFFFFIFKTSEINLHTLPQVFCGCCWLFFLTGHFNLETQSEGIVFTHKASSFHHTEYSRKCPCCIFSEWGSQAKALHVSDSSDQRPGFQKSFWKIKQIFLQPG